MHVPTSYVCTRINAQRLLIHQDQVIGNVFFYNITLFAQRDSESGLLCTHKCVLKPSAPMCHPKIIEFANRNLHSALALK